MRFRHKFSCGKALCYYRKIMKLKHRYQRFISLIALITMTVNLFAPTVAHAIAKVKGTPTPWMQVCSVSGIQYIPLDLNLEASANNDNTQNNINSLLSANHLNDSFFGQIHDKKTRHQSDLPLQHCAYCMSHAHHFAVFTQANLTVFDRHIARPFPPLFYQSHAPLFIWVAANPRAPPISS